jgi:hypothetical protein
VANFTHLEHLAGSLELCQQRRVHLRLHLHRASLHRRGLLAQTAALPAELRRPREHAAQWTLLHLLRHLSRLPHLLLATLRHRARLRLLLNRVLPPDVDRLLLLRWRLLSTQHHVLKLRLRLLAATKPSRQPAHIAQGTLLLTLLLANILAARSRHLAIELSLWHTSRGYLLRSKGAQTTAGHGSHATAHRLLRPLRRRIGLHTAHTAAGA